MTFISLPVLWNGQNSFQDGSLVNIAVQSRYVATTTRPAKPYPIGAAPDLVSVLQIEDPNLGTLYLNIPFAVYKAAIEAASGSNSPLVRTSIITASGTTNTITLSVFSGASLVIVWKNGIVLSNTQYSLSGDILTFVDDLYESDVVGIVYYTS